MIAVIFEVVPHSEKKQQYLDIAAALRPQVEQLDGFISIERFQSLSVPGKLLALSFWRDEEAVEKWRQFEGHRSAQIEARASLFQEYRLRVAAVFRDYSMEDREQTPADSRAIHG